MIYFMIIASIIVADKILKEYFKSSFQGKHREVRTKGNRFGVRKEAGKQKVKENLFRKKEQNKAELKQKRNNKEKNDWKNIGDDWWYVQDYGKNTEVGANRKCITTYDIYELKYDASHQE